MTFYPFALHTSLNDLECHISYSNGLSYDHADLRMLKCRKLFRIHYNISRQLSTNNTYFKTACTSLNSTRVLVGCKIFCPFSYVLLIYSGFLPRRSHFLKCRDTSKYLYFDHMASDLLTSLGRN